MPIAIDPNKPFDYVLEAELEAWEQAKADHEEAVRAWEASDQPAGATPPEPPDPPTVFELQLLTPTDSEEIQNMALAAEQSGDKFGVNAGSMQTRALERGWTGVRNFYDAAGEPVTFEAGGNPPKGTRKRGASRRMIARIAPKHRSEIARVLLDGTVPDQDLTGKF